MKEAEMADVDEIRVDVNEKVDEEKVDEENLSP